ncbi:hypothetical protein J0A67_10280 [Algoriphagus aestuariicola]|uniref:Uncharacterized protein n=1 Tax=Algoriphagus aestuariicola TaxID=1852016 RepID=A0ABS3BPQ9_9BACT|nr:hypothetical protein [Algoriphagus aestuariicola]MBN7801251.1 hypothetical protein [Algoriphagus aestuariicola]
MKKIERKNQAILLATLLSCLVLLGSKINSEVVFSTEYFKVKIDERGYVISMQDIATGSRREFSPADKPSPLMRLYDEERQQYFEPIKAVYNSSYSKLELSYDNGSVATVRVEPKDKYLKLTLESLSPRNGVDDIEWGSIHTNITNLLGEIIGVARDTSEAVNYAIGLMALDENTLGGLSTTIGDAAPFQYIIHSPDSTRFPLPEHLHEGQIFTLGGDGISDVAFYAHKEPYYRIMYGNAAAVDHKGRISIAYHSRDRDREREVLFSLIPNMKANIPNHLQVQRVPGVDFIGSSVAFWGSPDDLALMDVIQTIVLDEGLPYPKVSGKWVKDPAAYKPDALTHGGRYDSILSYTNRLGFKTVSLYDQGFLRPDRGNEGYIDGKDFAKKTIKLSSGALSHREFSDRAAKLGITIGRTTITNSMAPGTKDTSPIPSDSIWYQQKRLLAKEINATDTLIYVDDPTYLDEIGSWEGHTKELNIVKIGKELIHYLGVSESAPHRLLNVTRGYWDTQKSAHSQNDTIYKLQVTVGWGYEGVVPNLQLQDEIAKHYADVCAVNGLSYYDFDGQEFLFNNGHGYYSTKRFFRTMFDAAEKRGVPHIRFTGATLSEGSWHYQSIWNVGGGKNLYDAETREWGSSTSQGKDLRDVTYANFFPVGMGGNFRITANSKVEEYEHIQAVSVGIGSTYSLILNQEDVESCPEKDAIFRVIRTWENARSANAFPKEVKKDLVNPKRSWRLVELDQDNWKLYEVIDGVLANERMLTRAAGY